MIKFNYKYGIINFPDEISKNDFFPENTKKNVEKGTYQEYINDYAKKYTRENSIILDIGSNLGIFTISFSKLFPSCKVLSFEPIEYTFSLLQNNINENNCSNVTLYNKAVSNSNLIKKIRWSKDNLGGSTFGNLSLRKMETHYKNKEVLEQDIKVINLDSLELDNISFIKIDVQDHEYNVISGAKRTLKNNDLVIILELATRNESEIKNYKKCVKLMNKFGYKYMERCSSKDYAFRKKPF